MEELASVPVRPRYELRHFRGRVVHLSFVFVLLAAAIYKDILLAVPNTDVLRSRRMGFPLLLSAFALFEGVVQNLRSLGSDRLAVVSLLELVDDFRAQAGGRARRVLTEKVSVSGAEVGASIRETALISVNRELGRLSIYDASFLKRRFAAIRAMASAITRAASSRLSWTFWLLSMTSSPLAFSITASRWKVARFRQQNSLPHILAYIR